MHVTRFRQLTLYVALRQWQNQVKCIMLYEFKHKADR